MQRFEGNPVAPDSEALAVVVTRVTCEAKDVLVLDLESATGTELPPFEPGAHLELTLPNGLVRHYSLCNDPRERGRYRIGVGLSAASRGGSSFIHQRVKAGATLSISRPRNNFPLVVDAPEYGFVAGGIGITPILSMIHWCIAHGKRWQLYYCARSRQRAAFYEDLQALAREAGRAPVAYHFDDEQGGRLFDAQTALQACAPAAHVYCCGPAPLMEAVQAATRSRPPEQVHFEWFSAKPAEAETADAKVEHAFTVVLHRSERRIPVPPGVSILDALEQHGVAVPYSCREGLCGTCETRVLAGEPEHRDYVLSNTARAKNDTMMICVSRARSAVIELDL